MTGTHKIKRPRPSLVCENCKRKKIMCDKLQPCTQCVKAKLTVTCSYTARPVQKENDNSNLPYVSSAKNPLSFNESEEEEVANATSTNGAINDFIGTEAAEAAPVAQANSGASTVSGASGFSAASTVSGVSAASAISSASASGGNPGWEHTAVDKVPTVTIPLTELEQLKHRLNQIESSLNVSNGTKSVNESFIASNEVLVTNHDTNNQGNIMTSRPHVNSIHRIPKSNSIVYSNPHINGPTQKINNNGSDTGISTSLYGSRNQSVITGEKSLITTTRSGSFDTSIIGKPVTDCTSQTSLNPELIKKPRNESEYNNPNIQSTSKHNSIYPSSYEQTPYTAIPSHRVLAPTIPQPIHLPPLTFQYSNKHPPTYSKVPQDSLYGPSIRDTATTGLPNSATTGKSLGSIDNYTSTIDHINSLVGINPYFRDDDSINFYEGYNGLYVKDDNSSISFGPFAWASIMKRDKALRLLWETVTSTSKERNSLYYLSNYPTVNNDKSRDYSVVPELTFKKKAIEVEENADLKPYNIMKKEKKPFDFTKLDGMRLGLTYYDGKFDRELQLIEKIRIILPPKKVIWKLIRRFFSYVYFFTPFIDEGYFISTITKIIGPESEEEISVSQFNVENRLDLAHLGLLMIVLRLSYLSFFYNDSSINEYNLTNSDPSPEAQELRYLLCNPININIIDVARECFEQFQYSKRISFPVLQLAMFIKLYSIYAPEEGLDDSEPQSFNGIILYMCYQVGMNREPDKLDSMRHNPKLNNLRRKMWSYIRLWDVYYGCTSGDPMMINVQSYDTKLPYYAPGNENISDAKLDCFVTERFSKLCLQPPLLMRILNQVLNVNGRANMRQLCADLSDLELEFYNEFGSLAQCLKPTHNNDLKIVFANTLTAKGYIFNKAFFMSIYFYFYLHYEDMDLDLAFFYLKKLMLIAYIDIMPYYNELLGRGTKKCCDMIINPSLQNIISKSNQITFALIIRVNIRIHRMKSLAEHYQKCSLDENYREYYRALCRTSSYLTRCAEIAIASVSSLSCRYYCAWRITKGNTFLLKTITSVNYYKDFESEKSLRVPYFTLKQIEELSSLCELGLCKSESGFDTSKGQIPVGSESERYYGMCATKDANSIQTVNAKDGAGNNLNFTDSAEIDQLWFQMVSKKHYKRPYSELNRSEKGSANTPSEFSESTVSAYPGWFPNKTDEIDIHSFDIEQSGKYDMFSDLPFDQIFKK